MDELPGEALQIEITLTRPGSNTSVTFKGQVELDSGLSPKRRMTKSRRNGVIDKVEMLTAWEQRNIPYPHSRIAFLLFKLLGSSSERKTLTVKQVVLASGCSERAVRKILNKFEEHGWVSKKRSHSDRRNTFVEPTKALNDAYAAWCAILK